MNVNLQAHGVWEAVSPKDPKSTKETAKKIWEAIKVTCQGAERVKTAKVQTLKTEFESLFMKESDKIDDFSMKLEGLVTNIRALGEEIDESYVVKKLLRDVPTKFLQIASTIEQFGDLDTMTLEETVGSLKAHEERLEGTTDTGGNQWLFTREQWIEREKDESKLLLTREEWLKRGYKGGGEMSTQRFRGRDGVCSSRDKSKVRCFKCLAYGHYAIECKNPKREKEVK
ncbi:uncharacterized protein LOC141701840 [Apium graveolens]|uniref:uncharacterized protein LOC141701840 n=1 Tax=Apium graveolens TaxID=4045 RepID=UPI003D7A7BE3